MVQNWFFQKLWLAGFHEFLGSEGFGHNMTQKKERVYLASLLTQNVPI